MKLSNTKLAENIPEDLIGSDFACNFAQEMKDLSDIHGQEVAGKACFKAVTDAHDGFEGFGEGFVMAGIGDNHRLLCRIFLLYLGDKQRGQVIDVLIIKG